MRILEEREAEALGGALRVRLEALAQSLPEIAPAAFERPGREALLVAPLPFDEALVLSGFPRPQEVWAAIEDGLEREGIEVLLAIRDREPVLQLELVELGPFAFEARTRGAALVAAFTRDFKFLALSAGAGAERTIVVLGPPRFLARVEEELSEPIERRRLR